MIPVLAVACVGRGYLLNRLRRCFRLHGGGLEFRMKVRNFRLRTFAVWVDNNWTWGFHKLIAKTDRFFQFSAREFVPVGCRGRGKKSRTRVRLRYCGWPLCCSSPA